MRYKFAMHMRNLFVIFSLALGVAGCGGDAPTFAGVWDGSFTTLDNGCPFSVISDINPLFPMTVTVDENDVFKVVTVDGNVATGGQGDGETISFLATFQKFDRYGSISPYTCDSTETQVGYLTQGSSKAEVTITSYFNNCNTPDSTSEAISCAAIYYGMADLVG